MPPTSGESCRSGPSCPHPAAEKYQAWVRRGGELPLLVGGGGATLVIKKKKDKQGKVCALSSFSLVRLNLPVPWQ